MSVVFRHRLRVRYADTDAQGHVYFANYLTYVDEAHSAWLRSRDIDGTLLKRLGADFVYADAHVRYRGRARFGDVVEIELVFSEVKTTSVVVMFSMRVDESGEMLAHGSVVQVCVGGEQLAKRPWPTELRREMNTSESD